MSLLFGHLQNLDNMLLILIILKGCSSVCQTCLSLLKFPWLKSKALQGTIAWEFYRAPANDDAKYIVVLNGYGLSSGRQIGETDVNDKQGSSMQAPLQVNRVPHIRENVEAAKYGKTEPSCHACNGHTPQVKQML